MKVLRLYRDDRIRAAKAAQKLTDKVIARRTAVFTTNKRPLSRPTVGAICNGERNIKLDNLHAVAAVLKVSMASLFEFEEKALAA